VRVVALAGGTGSAKLLRGLSRLPVDLTAVANVGDNIWMYGAYVCPDIDIATYTLAGLADRKKGWGVEGDTFNVLEGLSKAGAETWFRLGDLDLATCLMRTMLLKEGATLTQATERIRKALRVRARVLPVTDSGVETRLATSKGGMHLQEFWVREHGRLGVTKVFYVGATRAKVTPEVRSAVLDADAVVLCPANPVTSIGPMLAVPGFSRLLAGTDARVVALSPMSGRTPFSGPAGKLLRAIGSRQDSVGVVSLYAKFLDGILISEGDASMAPEVESLGVRCAATDTLMSGGADEVRLAKELLDL
jgi:LPPG:FO 2-phospho-L-lactate transferase